MDLLYNMSAIVMLYKCMNFYRNISNVFFKFKNGHDFVIIRRMNRQVDAWGKPMCLLTLM